MTCSASQIPLSGFVWAAATNYGRLVAYTTDLLLTVERTRNPRLVSAALPLLLSFHCVLPWWKWEGALWDPFYMGPDPIHDGSIFLCYSPPKSPTS